MDVRGANKYKEQSINSMTPGELLLKLYDELVKRITLADITLKKEDYPTFEASVQHCIDIIKYLDQTLDKSVPISHEIARMYEYFVYTLGRVKIGRNRKLLDHVKPMLIEFRDTFREAEKISSGQLPAPTPKATAPETATGT